MSNDKSPPGLYSDLAQKVREKREDAQLQAELFQLAKELKQKAESLYPRLSKKRLWGLLTDAADEAERLGKDLGR